VAKLSKRAKQRNIRIEAAQLLGKWTSLAQGHVLMGGNCSCGLGAGSLRIEEFEQQILDYLEGKLAASGNAALTRALRELAGYERGKSGSLSALLRSITADVGEAGRDPWLPLLDDLKRTLESFEEAHRGA
jgi:hypothetical protein